MSRDIYSLRAVLRDATRMSSGVSTEEISRLIQTTCTNEIQSGFDKGITRLIEEMRSQSKSLRSGSAQSSSEVRDNEASAELLAKNESLELEVQRLKNALEQNWQTSARQQQDSEAKQARLRKIIIESGLNNEGPLDQEVENSFSDLRHNIFVFVRTHCTNETSKYPTWYKKVSSAVQTWWVVSEIARCLHSDLFVPSQRFYGFLNPRDDELLARIPDALLRDGKVPWQEMLDWRVRTCQLSKYSNPDTRLNDIECEDRVTDLMKALGPFWHYSPSELKKRTTDIRLSLADLYQQAFRLVMLFRRTKTEYRWLQANREKFRNSPLLEDQVDVEASAGYTSFAEAQRVQGGFRTVFGEVIKADGPSGNVSESWLILRKCSVLLLGPGLGADTPSC